MDAKGRKPLRILLVEDNPGDVRLFKEALTEAQVPNSLHVVSDGEAALDVMYRRGDYSQTPRPDLVVLDLNLPRKDGREVLATIKADQALRRVPVVVLTSSTSQADIARAYELHANCYVTKPVAFDEFLAALRGFSDFWLTIARLPRESV